METDIDLSQTERKPLKIYGLSMVRNEADIIGLFVAQAVGLFDKFLLVDVSSTDGTWEFLQNVVGEHLNLVLYKCRTKERYQAASMSALARLAIKEGADWLFFLDCDEFLPADGRAEFETALQTFPCDVMHLPWMNLIPSSYSDFSSFSWNQIYFWSGRVSSYRKVAVSSLYFERFPQAFLHEGNHNISPFEGAEPCAEILGPPLLHIPVRSLNRLKYKLTIGLRSIATKHDRLQSEGVHFSDIQSVIGAGATDAGYINAIVANYGESMSGIDPIFPEREGWPEKSLPRYLQEQSLPPVQARTLGATLMADAQISWRTSTFVKDAPVTAVCDGEELRVVVQPISSDGHRYYGRFGELPSFNPQVLSRVTPAILPKVLSDALAASLLPVDFVAFSAWSRLIPTLFALFTLIRPRRFVELGVHHGMSFFAACQVAEQLGTGTHCVAVDSWIGDPHAAYHTPDVFSDFKKNLQGHPGHHYIQGVFSDACESFENGSIDLLHIDGYHTYEAVKDDFNTWLPKMSDIGVIMVHDVNVHERNFGVWEFWQEVTVDYIGVSFMHSHGLGLLYVGRQDNAIAQMFRWLVENPAYMGVAQKYFERLGETAIEHRTRASELDELRMLARERDAKILELLGSIEHRDATIKSMTSVASEQDAKIVELLGSIEDQDANVKCMSREIAALAASAAAAEQCEIVIKNPEARAVVTKSLKRFERNTKIRKSLSFAFKRRRRRYKTQYLTAKQLLAKLKS